MPERRRLQTATIGAVSGTTAAAVTGDTSIPWDLLFNLLLTYVGEYVYIAFAAVAGGGAGMLVEEISVRTTKASTPAVARTDVEEEPSFRTKPPTE